MFFLLKHLFNYNSVQTFSLLYIKFLQKKMGQLHKSVDAHNLPNQKSCSSGT